MYQCMQIYTEEDEFDISDEVLNMDAMIKEIEENAIDTEEVIANVEYLSLFSDSSLNHLGKQVNSHIFISSIFCIAYGLSFFLSLIFTNHVLQSA